MPAIDPITVPVTMVVTNAAPLRAVTDALTDLATAIRNMLDDQAERESTATEAVLAHVLDELRRQDVKWGEQNHSDGTGPDIRWQPGIQSTATAAVLADEFRRRCQANSPGEDTWRDILLEEVAEALAENDPAKLRAELVQVAAVAVQWIEAIDRRRAHTPSATPTAEACTPECERVARRHLVHARSAHRDDIGAEVAECLVDYLEASLCGNGPSPDTTQDIVERILAACGIPAKPEPTIEPKPDAPIDLDSLGLGAIVQAARQRDSEPCQVCGGDRLRQDFTGSGRCHAARPVDLDSLGLGAVVRATVGVHRGLWVNTPDDGLPWVSDASDDPRRVELTDVEVLHPGITIGGEDA